MSRGACEDPMAVSFWAGLLFCARRLFKRYESRRSRAIKKSNWFYQPIQKQIYAGEISPTCGAEPSADVYALEAAQFVKIIPGKPGYWDVELTDAGARAMKESQANSIEGSEPCKDQLWTYSIGIPDSVTVTGLSRTDRFTEAEFQLHYRLTELGQLYLYDHPINKKLSDQRKLLSPALFSNGESYDKHIARFKLFDDGWRLVE